MAAVALRTSVTRAAHLALGLPLGVCFLAVSLATSARFLIGRLAGRTRRSDALVSMITSAEGVRFATLLNERGVIGRPRSLRETEQAQRIGIYSLLRLPLSLFQNLVMIACTAMPITIAVLVVVGLVRRWVNPGLGAPYLISLVALAAAPAVIGWLVRVDVSLASSLLGGDRERLESTVESLIESRRRGQDAADTERDRIERDLHDGAQQQLIALAVRLGRLERAMERGSIAAGGLDQVRLARADTLTIVADIRHLTRGLRPHLLQARGLSVAIEAVAARLELPCIVSVDLPERLSPEVERALFFALCELLTNMTKHSGASSATLVIFQAGDRVVAELEDDGCGGAIVRPGGGLEGLTGRLAGVGGTMSIASPAGGPTRIRLETPCA